MNTDLVLGGVTFVLAALGGVVSAHSPKNTRQRWIYGISFVVLGAVGAVFVYLQSTESDRTRTKLDATLETLRLASNETVRLENLNTRLQEKLIGSSDRIISLSKEGTASLTGGDSFCYLDFGDEPIIIHKGKYNLYSVEARVAIFRPYDGKDDPVYSIGDMAIGKAYWGGVISTIKLNNPAHENINVFFSAKNGDWTELLRIRKVDGHLTRAIRVVRGIWIAQGKSGEEILYDDVMKGFPVGELESDKDWMGEGKRKVIYRKVGNKYQ